MVLYNCLAEEENNIQAVRCVQGHTVGDNREVGLETKYCLISNPLFSHVLIFTKEWLLFIELKFQALFLLSTSVISINLFIGK